MEKSIDLNSIENHFKANKKVIEGIKEFLNNKNINKLLIACDNEMLSKSFAVFAKEICTFDFLLKDRFEISNLKDFLRKAVTLSYKSIKESYEGEIVTIQVDRNDSNFIYDIHLSLKTNKATKTIRIQPYLYESLSLLNIGDIVYIEPNVGLIKRLGRSENKIDEYDLEGDKYLPLHKGPVYSSKEKDECVSLYDLDYAFNKYNDDITDFTRSHVDSFVEDVVSKESVKLNDCVICFSNCKYFNREDLIYIDAFVRRFKCVKVLFLDKIIEPEILSDMFILNSDVTENLFDVLRATIPYIDLSIYQQFISGILNESNFNLIISILKISSTLEEFKIFYHTQLQNNLN